jgi:choline dehydrogenase-like flavoprotein
MGRLVSPFELIKDRHQMVVVGSGYGGSIVAPRLARAGQEVCVLEQGRELQPGEYPSTLLEAGAELQVDMPEFYLGSRTGLYQVVTSPDVNVFKGCGLGGTSLVNSDVAIEPEPRVFEQPGWSDEIAREAARADSPLADGCRPFINVTFEETPSRLDAEIVVLAGGALGSTEIQLRSARRGFRLSDQLGTRCSANGDVLGFGYDLNRAIDGMGWGQRRDLPLVGPVLLLQGGANRGFPPSGSAYMRVYS